MTLSSGTMMPSWRSECGSPRRRRANLERRRHTPSPRLLPPRPPPPRFRRCLQLTAGCCLVAVPVGYALDPHGAPCRTSPSVELHATLVSAQIQAELEAGRHVYAEQWARPPVQWGGVQWDRSLEIAIAAELSQPSRRRTAASQGTRRMLTWPATWPRARRGRSPAIARATFSISRSTVEAS